MRADDFFAFARARHAITLARAAGQPEPWTEDPILATYRFTNVFRELDRTTVWFRENVRDRLADRSVFEQVLGTILFRTLNRIESCEKLFLNSEHCRVPQTPPGWWYLHRAQNNPDTDWLSYLVSFLRGAMPTGPWVTGAYIVKTPDGMDKLQGALWIVEEARRRLPATLVAWDALDPSQRTLQGFWSALQGYPFIGPFTGFEIVTDLRWLPILLEAPDIMTWANAGPGAIRGLHRLSGRDYRKSLRQDQACREMKELLDLSTDPEYWPQDWPAWEMRDVEHTLCEHDKYQRVLNGEGRPRGVFR